MNFKTNCEAHTWPEPKDGWCPICIMNESDDVKRQRDKLREALEGLLETCHATEEGFEQRQKARAALEDTRNG